MKGVGYLTCEAPESHAGLGPLPVRVRTKTGEVVGSGVTGTPIAVPLGSYYIGVLTPDGREVGVDKPVRATPLGTVAPRPHDVAQAGPTPAGATPPLLGDAPAPGLPALLWRGAWLRQWHKRLPQLDEPGTQSLDLSDHTPQAIAHQPGVDQLLLLHLADRVRCTVVPYDECVVCRTGGAPERSIVAQLNLGEALPFVDFRSTISEETNALLRFVERGVLSDMVAVSEDLVSQGEAALLRLDVSVLRAVTGAYVLLRANALDGLERWLAQLAEASPAVPDLSMLRVELLARLGRHDEAVALMLATMDGQCPWFRAGLSYALGRVRLYVDVSDNKGASFALTPDDYARFVRARDALELMLPLMVTSRYIATFDLPVAATANGRMRS